MRRWAVVGAASVFLASGMLHLVRPALYRAIVPPALGHEAELVAISGVAEIAGGIGLLFAPTRRPAAYGLLALLAAVWPANWYMAIAAERFATVAPAWLLWLRVPLQLPLAWWIWSASR